MDANGKRRSETAGVPSVPRIDAGSLLSSSREIIIVLKDTEYRLRITSNEKLILTK